MILADSNVYIDLIRSRRDPRAVLAPYVRAGWLRTCDAIRLEVLRGVAVPERRHALGEFFDLIPSLPLNDVVWREAVNLGWRLDRAGRVLTSMDSVIAACALVHSAALVSADRHFGRIPNLKLWKTLPSPVSL